MMFHVFFYSVIMKVFLSVVLSIHTKLMFTNITKYFCNNPVVGVRTCLWYSRFKLGNSLTGSDKSANATSSSYQQYNRPPTLHTAVDNFDMMEYPFLTISKYPPGFILHLGIVLLFHTDVPFINLFYL